ncbi:MAG: vWA domain-containing protein [Planctomycetota bacterium]
MTEPNNPKHDELDDRLIDQALREVLGGEAPPDLSHKILAAANEERLVSPRQGAKVMGTAKRNYGAWIQGTLVACLVVGVAVALLLPAVQTARESARRFAQDNGRREALTSEMQAPKATSAPQDVATESDPSVWGDRYRDADVKPQTLPRKADSELSGPESDYDELIMLPPAEMPQANEQGQQGGQGSSPSSSAVSSEKSGEGQPGQGKPQRAEFSFQGSVMPTIESAQDGPVPIPTDSAYQVRAEPAAPPPTTTPGEKPPISLGRPTPSMSAGLQPKNLLGDVEEARLGGKSSKPQDEARTATELWSDTPQGQGPGRGGDRYDRLVENPFRTVKDHPLSTFSIDVDTASFANVRRFLLAEGMLPPPDAVRIEELINYFDYDYSGPTDEVPFAAHIEAASCPWAPDHRLVRIALKGREMDRSERPESNLVFLLDVSGSMDSPDKLPLVKEGMKRLARQLGERDRVAVVVYASAEGLVLPSTSGADRETILAALDQLQAGGSTAGGAGIELAYRIAQENFVEGGVNRVILCTDGDFNVGTTSTAELERMVEERAKSGVFLSVLGFGRGNLNDAMMETISNKGNGNYAYIDGVTEAHKVLEEQMQGTLVTIAKDVKIQVEFNPAQVSAYRLVGYENRMLAAEDFNDDKKDAGEIGAGHTVTALYEIVPAGKTVDVPSVDPLRYQTPARANDDDDVLSNEMLTLKLRYKAPDGDTSRLLEFPLVDEGAEFGRASRDFQFAAAVASFGMLLRGSEHKGSATYGAVLEIADSAKGADKHGYRAELLEMVRRAKSLSGQ